MASQRYLVWSQETNQVLGCQAHQCPVVRRPIHQGYADVRQAVPWRLLIFPDRERGREATTLVHRERDLHGSREPVRPVGQVADGEAAAGNTVQLRKACPRA